MPSPSASTYGYRLRQARKAMGWTQPELGRQLGLDDTTAAVRISRYESGQHMPDGPTATVLAKALRLPQAWFHAETDAIAEAILVMSKLSKAKQETAINALRKSANSA